MKSLRQQDKEFMKKIKRVHVVPGRKREDCDVFQLEGKIERIRKIKKGGLRSQKFGERKQHRVGKMHGEV